MSEKTLRVCDSCDKIVTDIPHVTIESYVQVTDISGKISDIPYGDYCLDCMRKLCKIEESGFNLPFQKNPEWAPHTGKLMPTPPSGVYLRGDVI